MIVRNPLEVSITVQIKGKEYSVAPKGEVKGVSLEDALYWKKLQGFLIIEEEGAPKVEVVKEKPVVVEEVEEKEAKPKKK